MAEHRSERFHPTGPNQELENSDRLLITNSSVTFRRFVTQGNRGLAAISLGNWLEVFSPRARQGRFSYSTRKVSARLCATVKDGNQSTFRDSVQNVTLNDSAKALAVAFPGWGKAIRTPF
jgi:hypothetical protein